MINNLILQNISLLENYEYCQKGFFSKEKFLEFVLRKINEKKECIFRYDSLLQYTDLEWDSEQLRIPVTRIDQLLTENTSILEDLKLKEKLLIEFIERKKNHYIFVRVDSKNLGSVYSFENTGFNLIDGILTFYLPMREFTSRVLNADLILREAKESDIDEISEIGGKIYKFDRFHNDPVINKNNADELHSIWLKNSVKKVAADNVFVAEYEGKIVSFVTCKLIKFPFLQFTLGDIILVGTNSSHQGQGFGKIITNYSLNWFKKQNVNVVQVKTQLANIPAAKTYMECGFKFIKSELTFRRYKK